MARSRWKPRIEDNLHIAMAYSAVRGRATGRYAEEEGHCETNLYVFRWNLRGTSAAQTEANVKFKVGETALHFCYHRIVQVDSRVNVSGHYA